MATSVLTSQPLNPNAEPWLRFLPHHLFHALYADLAPPPVPLPLQYSPVAVVPYYCHVAPMDPFCNFYSFTPVVVQPLQPPEHVEAGGGLCRRSAAVKRRAVRGKRTTVMIRNIPNEFSRYMLVDFLDQICHDQNARRFHSRGVRFEYDFVYLPMDFKTGNNLGYAFVNFTRSHASGKIWDLLSGYEWGVFEDGHGNSCESKKICEIAWAEIQGKDKLVKHFENSRFVCNNIEYLPVVFSPPRDGVSSHIRPTTIGSLKGLVPPRTPPQLSLCEIV